ncbi:MAG: hypothetical protein E6Q97_06470 [Desulfurellales bacterium]|nr:MAG: hypothetical protein E6Q97_06470 [Desulfurellales bacterium]
MRSIAPGLRTYLDAHASTGGSPVCLHHAPQDAGEKYFVIERLNLDNNATMDDPGDDSLISETVRVTAYGRTDLIAHTAADAVRDAIEDYTGAMGTDRVCVALYVESESGDYDPPTFVDGYAVSDLTLLIHHKPA